MTLALTELSFRNRTNNPTRNLPAFHRLSASLATAFAAA